MSVVAPALEASSEVRNTVSQGTALISSRKKSLCVQVRSRSPSPNQEESNIPNIPQAAAATRKRRRA